MKSPLRQLRENAGFKTILEAAAAIGVDKSDLGKYERGKEYPTVATVRKLARFYGVPDESIGYPERAKPANYRTVNERFWAKVDKSGDCWVWTGLKRNGNSYGRFYFNRYDVVAAHRFSYRLAYGPFDESLFVCHRCDNPPCVNPAHLFLGTNRDNMLDCAAKGRMARGEKGSGAKLSRDQVEVIRQKYASGSITQKQLAREYSTVPSNIHKIVKLRSWIPQQALSAVL